MLNNQKKVDEVSYVEEFILLKYEMSTSNADSGTVEIES